MLEAQFEAIDLPTPPSKLSCLQHQLPAGLHKIPLRDAYAGTDVFAYDPMDTHWGLLSAPQSAENFQKRIPWVVLEHRGLSSFQLSSFGRSHAKVWPRFPHQRYLRHVSTEQDDRLGTDSSR